MPNDTLAPKAKKTIRAGEEFFRSKQHTAADKRRWLDELATMAEILKADAEVRRTTHVADIEALAQDNIQQEWSKFRGRPDIQRLENEEKETEKRFEQLRSLNNGGYPRDVSPWLYWPPLFLVAVSEWYVNYSTFAARFVPAVAIACTVIIGLVFAYFSHLLGGYLAQYVEISHPSVDSKRVLDRKITLIGLGVVLMLLFTATMWLRYNIVKEQLGLGAVSETSVFRETSTSKIWNTLAPTIAVNIGIIAIGTVYSWFMHEKIPELRETYRRMRRKGNILQKRKAPVTKTCDRITALMAREKDTNRQFLTEYSNLQADILELRARISKVEIADSADVL